MKNEAANASIILEEFVMAMIMVVDSITYMKSNMSHIPLIHTFRVLSNLIEMEADSKT